MRWTETTIAMLDYDFMVNAFAAATIVAVIAGLVGFFLVLRGQTFAGHALAHVGFTGATGAVLIGAPPLWGLVAATVAGGIGMGFLGERLHYRDVAIGIVLAMSLGFGLLFLHFFTAFATEATALLFGNVLGVDVPTLWTLLGLAVLLTPVSAALAYFSTTGMGTAQATIATINGPSGVTLVQSGSSITVSWNAATLSTGGAVQGYSVKRSDGTTICGSPTLVTTLSCTDSAVPSGTYTYTVSAVYNSWASTVTSAAFTVLTAATISSEPPSASNSAAASFSFSGGNGSSYQCRLDGGAYASSSTAVCSNAACFAAGPYDVPNARIDSYVTYTNNPPCGAMRGFGAVQVAVAYEAQMDRLAAALGIDPVELRIANAMRPGTRMPTGQVVRGPAPVAELLERVRAMPLPPAPADRGRDLRELPGGVSNTTHGEGVRRGVGYAVGIKNVGFSEGFDDYSSARVRLSVDGGEPLVEVHTAAVEVGQGIVTVQAQIART